VHRVPLVIHPNNSLDPYDLRKHWRIKRSLRPVLRWLLAGTRALWTASELESERLDTFGVRVDRFVSPLPVELPNPVERPPDAPAGNVLFLGRLDRKKGIERLIQAVAIAQQRGTPLRTVIAGTGDEEYASALRELAESHLADGTFDFPGHVAGDEREALFRAASVFVLHSDNENFGIAVIEALGYGLPVVLSPEVYIAGDLAARGVAAVIPVHDIEALSDRIADAATLDATKRQELAETARTVAAEYDMPACAGRDASIRQALSGTRKGQPSRG
jgi:glycosyltransferase involved in cell wall biosynthesis